MLSLSSLHGFWSIIATCIFSLNGHDSDSSNSQGIFTIKRIRKTEPHSLNSSSIIWFLTCIRLSTEKRILQHNLFYPCFCSTKKGLKVGHFPYKWIIGNLQLLYLLWLWFSRLDHMLVLWRFRKQFSWHLHLINYNLFFHLLSQRAQLEFRGIVEFVVCIWEITQRANNIGSWSEKSSWLVVSCTQSVQ